MNASYSAGWASTVLPATTTSSTGTPRAASRTTSAASARPPSAITPAGERRTGLGGGEHDWARAGPTRRTDVVALSSAAPSAGTSGTPNAAISPVRECVGRLAAVVRRPDGPRGLADETGRAALVAEHRAPAADLDGVAAGQSSHRDRTGAGDQADPLVQTGGGYEEFGVSHDEAGTPRRVWSAERISAHWRGVSQACPPTATADGRAPWGSASSISAASHAAADTGSCGPPARLLVRT